jgi:hypothetical protein
MSDAIPNVAVALVSPNGDVTAASARFIDLFAKQDPVIGAPIARTRLPRLLPGLWSAIVDVLTDRAPRFRRTPRDDEHGLELMVWVLPARRPDVGVQLLVYPIAHEAA